MIRRVRLDVDVHDIDWLSDESIFGPDGVLQGMLELRFGHKKIFDRYPLGLNNSALSLVRSAMSDHVATDEAGSYYCKWPLFFCDGDIEQRCGVVKDFSVTHRGDRLIMTSFYGCAVAVDAEFEVAWTAWAATVEAFGTGVLRHLPSRKKGIKRTHEALYAEYRTALRQELATLRRLITRRGGRRERPKFTHYSDWW